MQLVNDKWYNIYSWLLTGAGLICLALSLIAIGAPTLFDIRSHGFTSLSLILASAILLYRVLAFNRVRDRYSLRNATFILNLLVMLESVNLINNTGGLHSWFHLSWVIMILFGGMFGAYMILSFLMLTTMYLIVITTNTQGVVRVDLYSCIVLAVNYLVGIISYLIWRPMYMDQESQQVVKLTGALKSKQQQAEILIQSISDGIIVTDTDGKINLLNQSASKMIGWPMEEATGISVEQVMKLQKEDSTPLDDRANPFERVLKTSEQYNQIVRLISRDNKTLIVSLVISPIVIPKSSNLIGTVAVFRDVSSARTEEHQRADFISTASHEMRTPVAAIEGYLALALNDKVSQVDAKARDYLVKAHESTQHLGKLFQDLLTSARAEDGRLSNHPQVIELASFVKELTDGLRFSADKKGLKTSFAIGSTGNQGPTEGSLSRVIKPLYYVEVDPDRLREVLTNLFDNAVKYTDEGTITIGLTGDDKVVQLFIRDSGVGIPPEDVPHLFQKFYRVDNSTTRTVGGSGLGLFICRKIIELYHGRIWVESVIKEGSTFYINLPRLSSQKAQELQQLQQSQPFSHLEA